MKLFAHIVTVAALLAAFFVGPLVAYGDPSGLAAALTGSSADLVSSATAIQAAPDGTYTILINANLHPNRDVLGDWVTFFTGAEAAPLIMEDVSAVAIVGDAAGVEMAESLQSRLAEHQMTLRQEVGVLAVSKAEAGRFDVLVMSDDAADAYGAESLLGRDDVVVIHR